MKAEAQQVLQAMSPAQKLRAAERLYYSAWQLRAAALRATPRLDRRSHPSGRSPDFLVCPKLTSF
jgi:hypothetical protein